MIEVSKKCIGCGKCVPVCPFAAVNMIDKLAVINEACTLCGACVQICPLQAIVITREEASHRDHSGFRGVWVYVELTETGDKTHPKKIKPVTFELLSAGRKLADELKEDLCAVLLADKDRGYAKELGAYGADKI